MTVAEVRYFNPLDRLMAGSFGVGLLEKEMQLIQTAQRRDAVSFYQNLSALEHWAIYKGKAEPENSRQNLVEFVDALRRSISCLAEYDTEQAEANIEFWSREFRAYSWEQDPSKILPASEMPFVISALRVLEKSDSVELLNTKDIIVNHQQRVVQLEKILGGIQETSPATKFGILCGLSV